MAGAFGAERVAVGRFEADGFSAEVGEELAAVDGAVVGEVEDADGVERAGGGGCGLRGHGRESNRRAAGGRDAGRGGGTLVASA